MKSLYRLASALFYLGIFASVPSAFGQADFYKGKTITVYIGTTPGALYDQWGRILAQHMGKLIQTPVTLPSRARSNLNRWKPRLSKWSTSKSCMPSNSRYFSFWEHWNSERSPVLLTFEMLG